MRNVRAHIDSPAAPCCKSCITQATALVAVLAVVSLSTVLFFSGCEVFGKYEGDNVKVQFGNTNGPANTQI